MKTSVKPEPSWKFWYLICSIWVFSLLNFKLKKRLWPHFLCQLLISQSVFYIFFSNVSILKLPKQPSKKLVTLWTANYDVNCSTKNLEKLKKENRFKSKRYQQISQFQPVWLFAQNVYYFFILRIKYIQLKVKSALNKNQFSFWEKS